MSDTKNEQSQDLIDLENQPLEIPVIASAQSKEDLERIKLSLEIKQLSEQWWKKPAYIAALLPTILAIGALLTAVLTGYFKKEYQIIELKNLESMRVREELDKERATLTEEINDLKTSLNTKYEEVKGKEKELTDKREEVKKELLKLNGERVEASQERARLENERESLNRKIAVLQESKAKLEEEYMLAEFRVRMKELKEYASEIEDNPDPFADDSEYSETEEKIIAILNEQKSSLPIFVKELEQELQTEIGPIWRGKLLLLLYRQTQNTRWKEQIIKIIREGSISLPRRFWLIFSTSDNDPWSDSDRNEFCNVLLETYDLKKSTSESDRQLFYALPRLAPRKILQRPSLTEFNRRNVFFDLVQKSQALINDRIDIDTGLDMLSVLSPQAFYISLAKEVARGYRPKWIFLSPPKLEDHPAIALNVPFEKGYNFARHEFIPGPWSDWLNMHPHLIKLWTEKNLETLRKQPGLAYHFTEDALAKFVH